MLKETRQLFRYVVKYPSRTWSASGIEFCLLLPAPGGAQLKITISKSGDYLVERIHAGVTMTCDRSEKEPSGYGSGVQLKLNQWNKDRDLSKQLYIQAKECNVSSYKSDVDYITCARKTVKAVQDSHTLGRSE